MLNCFLDRKLSSGQEVPELQIAGDGENTLEEHLAELALCSGGLLTPRQGSKLQANLLSDSV